MKSKQKAKGKALPDRIGNRNGKPQRRQETPNALCMLFGFAFLLLKTAKTLGEMQKKSEKMQN